MRRRTVAAGLAAGALLGACGGGGAEGLTPTAGDSEPPQPPPPAPQPQPPPPAPQPQPQPQPPPSPQPQPEPPPPQPEPGSSLLLDMAAALEPGEWRRVPTRWPGSDTGRSFKGFQTVSGAGVSADGMGWTERLVEHQGELLLPLMRDTMGKALAVMDGAGNWTRMEAPPGWSTTKGERRPFNRWFRDERYAYFSPADGKPVMGYFLRTPLEDPGTFERYGISIGDDQMDSVGNFSTCHAAEWDRFYAYTPGGKLRSWAEGETAWRDHFSHIPKAERNSGYGGTVIWNPIKREVITIGGQTFGANPDVSYRVLRLTSPAVNAKAEIFNACFEDGKPIPAITAGSSRFIVHPVTGEYLMLYRDGRMLRSADARVWSLYEDLNTLKPWGNYEKYCPWTHLSGTPDVLVMVSHIMGVWLHRLRDEFYVVVLPPPVEPPAEAPPAERPQPSANAGILARTIDGMADGEVRTVLPDKGHFRVQATTGSFWIVDWNPRMHWHAATQQLILFGHRIAHRVVAFSDALGFWRDIPLWPDYVEGGNGHWYGWSADDGQGGIYAKTRKLDVASETWTDLPPIPKATNGSAGTMYAWQSSVGRLVRYGGDIQRWQEYDPATNIWKTHKDRVGHGQHALLEYHPAHKCSLLMGGNNSGSKARLVAPGYTEVTELPDCPGRTSMSGGSWIVPHPDGGWLVRAFMPGGDSRIFHIRPGDTQWRDLGPFQKLGLGYQSAAIDPVRRVVLLATTSGLHVLKIPRV